MVKKIKKSPYKSVIAKFGKKRSGCFCFARKKRIMHDNRLIASHFLIFCLKTPKTGGVFKLRFVLAVFSDVLFF